MRCGCRARRWKNLIDNAVKFTERGRACASPSPASPVAGGKVRLDFTVHRQRPSASPAPRSSGLFCSSVRRRRTSRLPGVTGGAGLGLTFRQAHCKAMGRRPHGRERGPGSGSRFRLSVSLDQVAAAGPGRRGGRRRCLLSAALRSIRSISFCAEDNPYGPRPCSTPFSASSGIAARFRPAPAQRLSMRSRQGTPTTRLLMDVTLAGQSMASRRRGASAPRSRGSNRPACRSSACPAVANADDEAAGRAAGMDGYLTKAAQPERADAGARSSLGALVEFVVEPDGAAMLSVTRGRIGDLNGRACLNSSNPVVVTSPRSDVEVLDPSGPNCRPRRASTPTHRRPACLRGVVVGAEPVRHRCFHRLRSRIVRRRW